MELGFYQGLVLLFCSVIYGFEDTETLFNPYNKPKQIEILDCVPIMILHIRTVSGDLE